MVIDRNDTVAPLFWYVYVPHTSSRRSDHGSKDGFNVALYPNTVSYTHLTLPTKA